MNKSAFVQILCIAIIIVMALESIRQSLTVHSADLLALWLAGVFWDLGQTDQIYPAAAPLFKMLPPNGWPAYVLETFGEVEIYPYLYPPIWAVVMSWLVPTTSFATFDLALSVFHHLCVIGVVICAARLLGVQNRTTAIIFTAITFAAIVLTIPVTAGLDQNQPQMLVSFLIVLAFERAHSGWLKTAGATLALAAAIKISPLLFVVIFVARRQWGAVAAFCVAGAALGAMSVLLAGWPIHKEFLDLLRTISGSVIITNFSFSIDAVAVRMFFGDQAVFVTQPFQETLPGGWGAYAKPDLWRAISIIAQLGALFWVAVMAAKRPNSPVILPIAAVIFTLIAPLGWSYSYLTALAFTGALPMRLGRLGWILCFVLIVFFLPALVPLTSGTGYGGPNVFQMVGSGLMAVLAISLWMAFERDSRNS